MKLDNQGTNLLNAPKTLQDLAVQYQNKKNILNKKEQELENPEEDSKFKSFLNSFLADILMFTAALITLIITLVIIYVMYGLSKLKALVKGMLIKITLGMLYLVTNKIRKSSIIRCRFLILLT